MGKALIVLGDRIPLVGRLPGDTRIERGGATFYFPLTTCILLSAIPALVLNVVRRLFGGR